MIDMRILTVRQPWAHALAKGWKDVENRDQSTNYRGPVAIHAGLTIEHTSQAATAMAEYPLPPDSLLTTGHIIAVLDLVDVVRDSPSAWAHPGAFHWLVANARELEEPIPYTGALGLRWLDPTTATELTLQLDGLATPDTKEN